MYVQMPDQRVGGNGQVTLVPQDAVFLAQHTASLL